MALPSAAMSVPAFSAIRSPIEAVSVTLHGRATDADATSVAGNRSVRESGSGNHRRDRSGSAGAGITPGAANDRKSLVIFELSGREIESLAESGASQGAFRDPSHSHRPSSRETQAQDSRVPASCSRTGDAWPRRSPPRASELPPATGR